MGENGEPRFASRCCVAIAGTLSWGHFDVNKVVVGLSPRAPSRALVVEAYDPPEELDSRMGIWNLPEAAVLHQKKQVWVHVDYTAYRRAYLRAFPDLPLDRLVLDDVMNRRIARLKGFAYVRIIPISRNANSSHGGLSEGWVSNITAHRECGNATKHLRQLWSTRTSVTSSRC
jgi:hypothetical protein